LPAATHWSNWPNRMLRGRSRVGTAHQNTSVNMVGSAHPTTTTTTKEHAMSHDQPLADLRLLMFVGDDYEDLELWYPKLRLAEAGAHITVAGPKGDTLYKGKHGYPCRSDTAIALMESSDFHGVVIPGGFMPDKLRRDDD